ncbi:hypothetical protein BTN49_1083 [Candidatus Enterovibrio escicola]|uniref:Uncharacterized protein n=1 Tax=Candidatus Enterovibrio escicola TaxID=1927127 RepID=A0A2A5T4J6_9GAMM|nr:hypothetical protein BTN49_1083 [Candidatus Enterovibrio escacola]
MLGTSFIPPIPIHDKMVGLSDDPQEIFFSFHSMIADILFIYLLAVL